MKNRKEMNERRVSHRFPIERDLRYKTVSKRSDEESGTGKTVNVSSGGVLFSADRALLPGQRIEVAINWPAQLNDKVGLELVARGRVVRYEEGMVAMDIQQHEFRTMGTRGRLRSA